MARLSTVLADGYDREAFERALARSAALREVCERFARLLPHPQPLVRDIFCALFKLNAVLRPARELSPAVLVNRSVLETVLGSGALEGLRRQTALDETNAAVATAMLGRRVLEALAREFRAKPEALAHAAEAARNEEALEARRAELAHLERTGAFGPAAGEALAEELQGEIGALEARLRRDRRRQREAAEIASRIEAAVDSGAERIGEQVEAPQQHARGLGIGGSARVDADRRLELGERILRSEKLRRLARLVGAMREVAFESRRRRAARSPQEMHAVALGAELSHLLPSELLGLRGAGGSGRALRMDFLRRFAERRLLQYRLEAPSQRGPMVVCLDGSGSMQGAKELWGKAVALTLMEIARRERRRCLALTFSAGAPLFEVELLASGAGGARARVRDEEVLRFAEHFPGGGTDFEPPLARALEAVTEGTCRRGDVVFITDGHARVSEALVERIDGLRKRHRFRIRAILVDVAEHDRTSLDAFADDVRSVRDLASDAIGELFASV